MTPIYIGFARRRILSKNRIRPLRAVLGIDQAREIVDLIPGVLLATCIMLVAFPLADLLGHEFLRLNGIDLDGKKTPFSGVSIAILIGLIFRNVVVCFRSSSLAFNSVFRKSCVSA